MSYEVKIVADSIGPTRARLTTFALRYPRFIHSAMLTHRVFSRNASSTRAIPTAKMIEWIERDPAMPVYWGKNQKGMQATEELNDIQIDYAKERWLMARHDAIIHAKAMMDAGVHKQIASRILEPWAHINVVVSSTDFHNFFSLRCHKAAMPEIQVLAVKMARAYRDSVPCELTAGQWHLPFATPEELSVLCDARLNGGRHEVDSIVSGLKKACVARCARVSYKTFDDREPDFAEDCKLHDRLSEAGHWSPFEHVAQALAPQYVNHHSGNFRGWEQYRRTFTNENRTSFDFATINQFENDFIV